MIRLEHLRDGSVSDRNFETLARAVMDTGADDKGRPRELAVRFGTKTVTYAGGTTDANAVVTHGLGKTPVVVFTQSGTLVAHARPASIGATTFDAALRTVDGTNPVGGTVYTVYWLVIG